MLRKEKIREVFRVKQKRTGLYKLSGLLLVCVLLTWWAEVYPMRTFPPAIEKVQWMYVKQWSDWETHHHMLDAADVRAFYEELQNLELVRRGTSWEDMNAAHHVVYEAHSCYQVGRSDKNLCWANFYLADDGFLLFSVSNQFVSNQFVLYEDVSGNYDEFFSLVRQLDEKSQLK